MLRIDPRAELYPLLQRWPTPSKTSELLLVRREGNDAVFLNDLRFQKNTALTLRIPLTHTTQPAVKAVLGETGNFKGLDYRGVPVLAALRAVPGSPWFLVAKVDAEEIYAPMQLQFWTTIVLVCSVLTAIGTTVASFWRRQQVRFYHERAEAAEALRESERKYELERKYRAILDQTLEFIGMLTPDGTVIEANGAALNFIGAKESDVLGKPFWETPWWSHSPEMQDRLRKAVKDVARGEFARFEATHQASDGEVHHIDFSLKPVKDESGEVLFLIPEGRDVTDRKRAEEGLREFETRFRDIIDNSREGIVFVDMDARTIFSANQAMAAMLGRTPEDLAGMPILDIHPADARDQVAHEFEQHRTGNRQVSTNIPVLREDGSRMYVDIVSTMVTLNGVRYMSGFFRDVTDRKRAEDALRQHEMELTVRNEELTRFNAAATGRELRMIELKQEVNELCRRVGEPPRYGLQFLGAQTAALCTTEEIPS
jgi:PAS domain S-box-containing protein